MKKYNLAQVNIGQLRHDTNHPSMAEFMDNIDPINALAEKSKGFVWRLKDATSVRPFPENDMMVINLSVWEDISSLHEYTYKTAHAYFIKNSSKWFEHLNGTIFCMWWIPVGSIPTELEARDRILYIRDHGSTPYAFTFRKQFSPPD